MQTADQTRTALPLRDHTILGVCEAIGEDFGFDPTFLRVPLAACVLYSLKYAVAAYLLLGVVVLVSRLLFPQPKSEAASISSDTQSAATAEHAEDQERLAIAA
ncbi:MAG TPA: PspC domain-containing protein [Sphingomicrobium sp.]|nr:PspC domain-containing protein [Sphingomicrobium sp.]